jgi:SH3-like domain-containing protein
MMRRVVISVLVVPLCFLAGLAPASDVGRTTGLPVPRFVSTKTSPANVRVGPGTGYPLKWTFVRRDLPLEIIAEFGHWRQIRDWEGKQGWMFGALLSGRRTALVAPWSGPDPVSLRSEAARAASVVALVQPNVLVRIDGCDGKWCKVKARTRRGYLPQTRLWGAYPDEAF